MTDNCSWVIENNAIHSFWVCNCCANEDERGREKVKFIVLVLHLVTNAVSALRKISTLHKSILEGSVKSFLTFVSKIFPLSRKFVHTNENVELDYFRLTDERNPGLNSIRTKLAP